MGLARDSRRNALRVAGEAEGGPLLTVLVCTRRRLVADPKVEVLDALPVAADLGGVLCADERRYDEGRLAVARVAHLGVARPIIDHDGGLWEQQRDRTMRGLYRCVHEGRVERSVKVGSCAEAHHAHFRAGALARRLSPGCGVLRFTVCRRSYSAAFTVCSTVVLAPSLYQIPKVETNTKGQTP